MVSSSMLRPAARMAARGFRRNQSAFFLDWAIHCWSWRSTLSSWRSKGSVPSFLGSFLGKGNSPRGAHLHTALQYSRPTNQLFTLSVTVNRTRLYRCDHSPGEMQLPLSPRLVS